MINGEHKLTPAHRARKAVVYLRQSSDAQVKHNHESQNLQYALADRARELGFADVEIIDDDLGASAAFGAKRRAGFERLLAQVALGEVGLVLGREVSRLLRTDKDWCRLVELCSLFDTLLGDADGFYDLRSFDDHLVLGIKGTISVVELKILRRRLHEGKENKAKRGALYQVLPAGYVLDANGQPCKDPNLRVQEAIGLVFTKFRETWSIRQTLLWFLDHHVELPVTKWRSGKAEVVFQRPTSSFVANVLHHPFYAGAYVYGRRPQELAWADGAVTRRQGHTLAAEQARVFLPEHHVGYIDWPTFQENLRMIRRNSFRGESQSTVGAVREGRSLLAGLLRCGRCGRKVYVRYAGGRGTTPRYLCKGTFGAGGSYCLGFSGMTIDKRFGEEIVRVISPCGLRASLAALDQLGSVEDGEHEAFARQVEQLDYEVARAFEQYNAVDARNRLVAAELERRWNDKLAELERARQALGERSRRQVALSEAERARLFALGERFAEVWGSVTCPTALKKKIARTVVEEVIVREEPPGTLEFAIRWMGGAHTAFALPKPARWATHTTSFEDLDIIRKMAVRYGDNDIARVLGKLGRSTGKGHQWTETSVHTARRNHGIAGQRRARLDPEILSFNGAARHCGVSDTTIRRLAEAGLLPTSQLVPYAPWEIRRADLDAPPVYGVVEHLKRTGKLVLKGEPSMKQVKLLD